MGVKVASVAIEQFSLSEDAENDSLEYSFQHMPDSLLAQSQQMYSSQ
jgi:hypothetical protein